MLREKRNHFEARKREGEEEKKKYREGGERGLKTLCCWLCRWKNQQTFELVIVGPNFVHQARSLC
jgi:hypothetical protein